MLRKMFGGWAGVLTTEGTTAMGECHRYEFQAVDRSIA